VDGFLFVDCTKNNYMKKLLRIVLSSCFIAFLFSANAQSTTSLTASEFEKGIVGKDSIQLLDVRTADEYNGGHIQHALLADWKDQNEFSRRIGFIDKEKQVYVYCLGGGRSAAAAAKMREMGYLQVYELKGGINAWRAENKTVEGKSNEKQMSTDDLNKSITSSKFVLVDFGAEWCPPCKKMEPVLKSLQANNPNKFVLVKVDGGKDEAILKQYNVTALPVFIVFKDGKQVWRRDGTAEEKEIAAQFK
jgi:rhodanese-related sulfurtransferase